MFYIGIDLGGTNIAAGLVNKNGEIISKESIPTLKERDFKDLIADMARLSIGLIRNANLNLEDIKSIGIGSPGTIDSKNGVIVYSNNIALKNVNVKTEIQKYIKLPIFIDNDANCAALAESVIGAAKGIQHSITITLGTGVGSGVIIDGKIYSGFNYSASELGHTVIVYNGEQCTCGRKGCFEAYASATALINQTKKAVIKNQNSLINKLIMGDLNKIDGKISFDAAKQGDETAKKIVNQYIEYLAVGISNIINAFQPEVLVIGGGISNQGEYLINKLKELVDENIYCKDIPQTQLKIAKLGNDAGIVGAAMLGRTTV